MTTTSEKIAAALAKQLFNGELRPQELSRTDLLAQRFQVSPGVVCTARTHLEDRGLVTRTPSGYAASPVHRGSPVNKVERVEQFVLAEIAAGRYKPGGLVATGAQLAHRLGVSLTTAGDALRHLKDQGVLHGGRGRSATRVAVAGQKPPRTTAERAEEVATTIRRRIQDRIYPPGTLLPSNRTLAMEHRVPQHVIIQAIKVLADDGTIETLGSVGKLVRDPHGNADGRQLLSRSEQFIADFCDDVLSGAMSPGTLLPSTVRLGQRYRLGQTTVAKAVPKLLSEGLIEGVEEDNAATGAPKTPSQAKYRITSPNTWPDARRNRPRCALPTRTAPSTRP